MLEALKELSIAHKYNYPLLGVIVFNAGNPHLKEMLHSQNYVDALDELTGDKIAIFWAALPEGRVKMPSPPPGVMANMIPMYIEPSKNRELYDWFGIRDGQSLPLLILFSFNEEEHLVYRKYGIVGDNSADVYNSLSVLLSEKCNLLSDFQENLKSDKASMFEELDLFDKYNEGRNLVSRIITSLASFRGASGI